MSRSGRHALRRQRPAVGLALLIGLVTGVVFLLGGGQTVTGQAQDVQQDEWSTLSDPASGLTYQIPPTDWHTNPAVGSAGPVTLTQGAERTAYTCGKPVERLLRGVLGSGSAPRTDPTGLADAVARAAASQYYHDSTAPTVKLDPPQKITRSGRNGVLVRAVAIQHADHCLASTGEVLVFVLQFGDHDGVLVVNGDLAGGPANPAPATDAELRAIVGTARPTP
ncbi:MAG TPA: hypothetical protein VF892_07645 [Pseudonocardiaceae bacterium]